MRLGEVFDAAARESAGVIASSNGSAIKPRNKVRRSRYLPTCIAPTIFFRGLDFITHPERIAVDNPRHQNREPVSIGRHLLKYLIDGRPVEAFHAPTKSIRQHLLHQVAGKEIAL